MIQCSVGLRVNQTCQKETKLLLCAYWCINRVLQLTTTENTIRYHNTLCWSSKILHKHQFRFLLGPFEHQRETEDNAYAKFWSDQQRVLWYVMVFSVVINTPVRI